MLCGRLPYTEFAQASACVRAIQWHIESSFDEEVLTSRGAKGYLQVQQCWQTTAPVSFAAGLSGGLPGCIFHGQFAGERAGMGRAVADGVPTGPVRFQVSGYIQSSS